MPSKLSDYEVLYTIGSGSYGKCLKVRRRSDSKIFVWKDMDYGTMTEGEKQQLVFEVNLLRELKHKHIVRYHDRIIDRSRCRLYLIMEYCAGGDLASLISKHRRERKFVEEEFVLKILLQLILALKACHSQQNFHGNQRKVLHRDLKPANVFLDEEQNAKLGDFGLARVLQHETSFAKTFVGTPYYMSPEQMSNDSYNEKSDLWSLGCLIYELCALSPPFTAPNQRMLAVKIKDGIFRRIPSKYSERLQNCVESMLRQTPSSRPSLDQLLNLPILKVFSTYVTSNKAVASPKSSLVSSSVAKNHKEIRRSTSTSSSSVNSNSTKKDQQKSKDEILIERLEKEQQRIVEKMKLLEVQERNIRRREALVEDREKLAENKMKTAEALIRKYHQMKNDIHKATEARYDSLNNNLRSRTKYQERNAVEYDRNSEYKKKLYQVQSRVKEAPKPRQVLGLR